ncbi:MAG: hypothetical protein GY703_19810, partial [Gammaproteobacteria bacterium]|nr:hypothetical protein [Gammaproteobacteria bacterium]
MLMTMGAVVAGAALGSMFGGDNGLGALKDLVNKLAASQKKTNEKFKKWIDQSYEQDKLMQAQIDETRELLALQETENAEARLRDRELGNSIKQLARHTDEQFAEVHEEMGRFAAYVEQQITGIVTSVDELTRAGVETATAVDTLRDAIGLLAARTESGLQNLTTIVSERETLLRGELQ